MAKKIVRAILVIGWSFSFIQFLYIYFENIDKTNFTIPFTALLGGLTFIVIGIILLIAIPLIITGGLIQFVSWVFNIKE